MPRADAKGVPERGCFGGPFGLGELVEREHASSGEDWPNGIEHLTGGLVQVEVEAGQGNDGLWVLAEVPRKCLAHVTLDDEGALNVAKVLAILMGSKHFAEVAGVVAGHREYAWSCARTDQPRGLSRLRGTWPPLFVGPDCGPVWVNSLFVSCVSCR